MKTKVFTLLSTLFFSANVFSQGIHMGLQVTPSAKWLSTGGGGIKNDGINLGFAYGVNADFDFTDNYALATGVQLAYRGGPFVHDSLGLKVSGKLNAQLVEVPITIKMRTNDIGHIKYYGQFGILPGYILSAKAKGDYSGKVDKKNINIALLVGGGIQYNIASKTDIVVALLYNQGFSDITKDDGRISLNSIGLMLGVIF